MYSNLLVVVGDVDVACKEIKRKLRLLFFLAISKGYGKIGGGVCG